MKPTNETNYDTVFGRMAVEQGLCTDDELRQSLAEALAAPRGDIRLAFCEACGMIFNTAFDPTLQEYTSGYEAQQSFSPRFRAFQSDLIERLIDRYDLRDKDVVEIHE